MPKRYSTVEIVDGKVVFSQEVLSYFENIRNEENSEWIDKYFEYLSDENNLTAEKYNGHHIIPCFVFKDKTHRTRKETEPLADKVEGNIIKLSIYNHLLAHHCLWKIFENIDSKISLQRMYGQKKYINDLSEDELKEIAILKEESAKKNQTDEEKKMYEKHLYNNNKEKILKRQKEYRENNKEEILKRAKIWRDNNKEKESKRSKKYYKNNKEQESKRHKIYYNNNKEEILKRAKIWRESNKKKVSQKAKKYREDNKEELSKKEKERNHRQCYDPIAENFCTYRTLRNRKSKYKELYKNVILSQCVIQTSTPST